MRLVFKALEANHGDAILIEISVVGKEPFRILVDGGPAGIMAGTNHPLVRAQQAGALLKQLDTMRGKTSFDLTILTHIDSDHIGGILAAYRKKEYRTVLGDNVWFNSARLIAKAHKQPIPQNSAIVVHTIEGNKTSVGQGVELDDLLEEHQSKRQLISTEYKVSDFHWGSINILSPTRAQLTDLLAKWVREKPGTETSGKTSDYKKTIAELQATDKFESDSSVTNGSSIAFLMSLPIGNVLLLGDAFSSTVCDSISDLGYSSENRLDVEICKLSHHGSKGNTCERFLSLVNVKKFVISTNGAKHLPDKQTIARIFKHSPTSQIVFNYPGLKKKIFTQQELETWSDRLPDGSEIVLN